MRIVPVSKSVPDSLIAGLADREVSIWLRCASADEHSLQALLGMLRLPWKQVFIEHADPKLASALDEPDRGSLVRRRGYLHVIDTDPSRIELPRRALPVFLLSGRDGQPSNFEKQLQRMTMLNELRRSAVRQLVVVGSLDDVLPLGLKEIWAAGFRTRLTVVSDLTDTADHVASWLDANGQGPTASVVSLSSGDFAQQLASKFVQAYADEHVIIRQRDDSGELRIVDLTDVDDPESPILESYDLLLDRDFVACDAEELPEESFNSFFRGEMCDWRPFAAGLPWIRDDHAWKKVQGQLKRLDTAGAAENRVAYIVSEPGAGGTTLARHLAFSAARAGYPTLVAKSLPFTPDPLPLINFLTRAKQRREDHRASEHDTVASEPENRLYETPWLLVFDRVHWELRDADLRRFRQQFEQAGRPVCILVVTGPQLGTAYYDESRFKPVAELRHMLDEVETLALGRHVNRYLRAYGKERPEWQWSNFQAAHSVRYLEGMAAFWITLSFWLQTQYDLNESIQTWVYRVFQKHADTPEVRKTILQIAAFSSERLPMPESLIEQGDSAWPIHLLLDDRRSDLSSLGLIRHSQSGRKYWAMAHDILGRFLLNALFFDFQARSALGYEHARDAQHLRFLVLRDISRNPRLGEADEREYGEEFATTIFKVDPDHGRSSWLHVWSEVLTALDNMPAALRNGSRVFRHHTAISRRRIAWLDKIAYGVTDDDKVSLLTRAIDDLLYALRSIERKRNDEPDLFLYNSLANAYFDLARVRAEQGAPAEELAELRKLASDATRQAYDQSPSSPYVIETHVKSLIASAEETKDKAAEYCIEALEILYAAISNDRNELRRSALVSHADRVVSVLMRSQSKTILTSELSTPTQVLVAAWSTLANSLDGHAPESLDTVPSDTLAKVLAILGHPAGSGNPQVAKLQYQVLVAVSPFDFDRQLETLEPLTRTDYRLPAQLRLEYALLLFQKMRTKEADSQFKELRSVWRETEIFGQVPSRLRWLLQPEDQQRRVVSAVSAYDHGHRAMARVKEFGQFDVPYRAQEFGVREHRSGQAFAACVSFGHNGPFLRPVNAPRH